MVAFLLKKYDLPPNALSPEGIVHGKGGFCRHGDLGQLGGGHTACPTTDPSLWRLFETATQHEYHRGGFRPFNRWGR